jgi:release factor glutamine methyltransferase
VSVSSPAPERETLGKLLRAARDRLRAAGIDAPEIEAELLMRQALRRADSGLPTKAWLLPRLGQDANDEVREALDALVARRLDHEPSAYITGLREFCALDFEVTPDVLIPRPETELLVGKALEWAAGASGHFSPFPAEPSRSVMSPRRLTDPLSIVDAGTGSGAIAVALARHLPTAGVFATDISWAALAVARRNARRHGVEGRIAFRHGDLLTPIPCYVDLIVANLPYVTEADYRNLAPEVREHEPALALLGGADGLDLLDALLRQAPRYLRPGGAVCLEFGARQADALRELCAAYMPNATVSIYEDFAGIPRVFMAQL